MNAKIQKFLKEEDGVTALEYGILAAIVAGVIATAFKGPLTTFFSEVFTTITNESGVGGTGGGTNG